MKTALFEFKTWEWYTLIIASYFLIKSWLDFVLVGVGMAFLNIDFGSLTLAVILTLMIRVFIPLILVRWMINRTRRIKKQ